MLTPPSVLGRKRKRPNGPMPGSDAHLQRQPGRRRLHHNVFRSGDIFVWFINGVFRDQSRAVAFDAVFGADSGVESEDQCCAAGAVVDGVG